MCEEMIAGDVSAGNIQLLSYHVNMGEDPSIYDL